MKKIISLLVIFIASTLFVNGQECYTLKMNVKVEGLPPEYAAYGEQEIVTQMKGDKSKTEMNSMMGSNISYFDGKVYTSLSEMMGNKNGFTATKEEMEAESAKEKTEKPKVTYTGEKKTIAGYECTKALVTVMDKDKKENTMIVWATEKIKSNPAARKGSGRNGMMDLGDLKGQPLELEVSASNQGMDMKVKMTTTEVLTSALDDSIFTPNTEGYSMMSYKDYVAKMKSMSGGK